MRWIVGLLIGLEVFYIVAANLLLEFGGIQKLFGSTDTVKVDFTRAWSVIPGRIHVQNVKLVIADHNIQCLVALDRVAFTLRLSELPGKVFHATKLRGSGLSLHFRNRVQPEDAKRPYVSALPPVPGFDDPPLYEAYVPTPPIPDAKYNLWTVYIEDVDVHIKELWAQQFRYLGNGRARGAFRLMPARNLWVGPAILDLDPGRLLGGEDIPFLDGFGGHIAATVHYFDVRIPKGREVLRNISTQIDLKGRVAGTQVFDLFTDPVADVRVDQQGATIAVAVGIDHGVAKPRSRVDIQGDALTVRKKTLVFDVNAPWSIVASADDAGPGSHVDVSVAEATLGGHALDAPVEKPPAPMHFESTKLTVRSTSRDTAGEWGMRGGSVAVGRVVAPELRMINEAAPSLSVRFTRGSGEIAGRAAYDDGVITADGHASLDDAIALAAGQEIRGTLDVRSTLDHLDAKRGTYAVDADVDAKDLGVVDSRKRDSCPWGRAGAVKIGARLARTEDQLPTGRVDGSMEHVSTHVGGATLSADVVVHVATDKVSENRTVLDTVVRAKQLKAGGGKAQERWDAEAEQALFQSELDWGDTPIAGPVRLFLRDARGGMRVTKLNGDAVVDLRLASVDRKSRSGEVSGTIQVKNADIATGDRHVEKWWGELNIERTRVSLDNDLSLDGSMTTKLKDGVPLLFMLSERDQIPDWLPEMLPLNNLSGKVSVHKSCHIVDVAVPELAGGPLSATGRVTRHPDEVRGAILVRGRRAGLFSAGIGIGKKSGGLSLFAGDDWLKGHLEWLRNATNSLSTGACEKSPQQDENACER